MTLSESRSGLILQRGLYLAVCVPRESLHAALYFIVCVPRERFDYVHFSSGPRSEPVREIAEFTVDPGKSRCVRLRCESVCG